MNKAKLLAATALTALVCSPACAQWQVTNDCVPIGRGPGQTGFDCSIMSVPGNIDTVHVTVPDGRAVSYVYREAGHGQQVIAQEFFQATNDAGNNINYGQRRFFINDNRAGLESGCSDWYTIAAGSYSPRFLMCRGLFASTLGDEGDGTGNFTGLYVNNVPIKIPLSTNHVVYVAESTTTTADDEPSCVAPATAGPMNPCHTLQYAWNQLYSLYDARGHRIDLRIADGETLHQGLQMFGNIQGIAAFGNLRIIGNIHNALNTTIKLDQPTSGYCASGTSGTYFSAFSFVCDGGEGYNNCFDKFALGQYSVMAIGDVVMRGSYQQLTCNSTNDFSMSNGASINIVGDLYFTQGHRQVLLYAGALTNSYLNVNGVHSQTTAAGGAHLTVGSNVITFGNQFAAQGSILVPCNAEPGCLYVGDQIRDDNGFIPRNAFVKSIVTTGPTAFREIQIKDLDGNDYLVTTCGGPASCDVRATMGGIFWHFYDDGIGTNHSAPAFDVSMIFGTEIAGLNLQGIEFSGRLTTETPVLSTGASTGTGAHTTNQSYAIKAGTQVDFGTTTLVQVEALYNRVTMTGPASVIPGVTDARSAAVDDVTPKNFELTRVPSGIFSGLSANNAINCTTWGGTSATPVKQVNGDCLYYAAGAGEHKFYGNGGSDFYATLKNIGAVGTPQLVMGLGAGVPDIASATYFIFGLLIQP